ncbi:PREDICTED: osteoclast-associated immunoglobulin-like receptor, partial [Chlamydotis macqueenii]|uniref:osteoclast-associated immunoglobulin-like receptor n=1 Tax=Chlamydotis macqueenii TaxID=187382 RepID=UPI000529B90C
MLPVTLVLAFGAWLVAQSKATPGGPRISISRKPPGVIALGGSITIYCSCQCANGTFWLYRNGKNSTLKQHGSMVEFFLNVTENDTHGYNCHYVKGRTVVHSESLDVMVQELRLPAPVLSVMPGQEVAAGAYVTFRCTTAYASTSCYLYVEGRVETYLKGQDDFTLSHVHKGNEGRYSCQCFIKNISFEWSAASKSLDLVVRDYTWGNAVRLALGAGVLVLLG